MHSRKPAGSSVLLLITLLIFSLVLPFSPAVSAAPAPAATSPSGSSDLNTNDGDTIFIQYLSNKGIMKGFPDGSFRPQEGLTRAQAATLLIKAAGIAPASGPSKFKDLKADHWAYASIATAEKAGFISGFPDGTFHPEEGLTRAQGISLALRLSKQPLNTAVLPALADMNSQHWAAPAVATGLAAQMVALSADNKSFLPNAPFSRGNMARALGILLTQDPGLYGATLTGTLKVTSGTATLQSGTGDPVNVTTTASVKINDIITTGAGCTADLSYPDGSSMLLKENSTVSVQEAQGRHYIKADGHEGVGVDYLNLKIKEGTLFGAVATTHAETAAADSAAKTSQLKTNYYAGLNRPQLLAAADQPWYEASKTKKVKVKVDMPWGVAAIRGTFVMINVAPNGQSSVSCLTGSAEVSSGGASVPLSQGQASAVTSQGAPPAASTALSTAVVQAFAAVKAWVEQVAQAMDNAQPATIAPPAPAVTNPALAPAVAAPVNPPAAVNPAATLQTVQSAMSATGVTTAASSAASSTPSSSSSGSSSSSSGNSTSSGSGSSGGSPATTAPSASGVIISDSPSGSAITSVCVGSTVYGQYTYSGSTEGTSLYQWYSGSLADGSDRVEITGATSKSYTVASTDAGKYLIFRVTPVAASGSTAGTCATSTGILVSIPTPGGGGTGTPCNTWTVQNSGTTKDLRAITSSGSQYVVVGRNGTILTSTDGITWTARTSGTTVDLFGVCYNGSLFVAVGWNGTILTSPDGITWTARTSNTAQGLWGLTWQLNRFVAVGVGGTIITSPDGITWTVRTSGTSEQLIGVSGNGSQLVAVGYNATILTSTDGITWTPRTSNYTGYYFEKISFNGSLYVVVDGILTSPDGITWSARASGATRHLQNVEWFNNQFVAVGSEGTILTSPDGISWSVINSGISQNLYDIIGTASQAVAVGASGTILTLPGTISGGTASNSNLLAVAAIISGSPSGSPLTSASVGATVYGRYTFTGGTEGASTFQWYRASRSDGSNKTAISGATTSTYQLTNADLGYNIFFEVTPCNATGTAGTAVLSSNIGVTPDFDMSSTVPIPVISGPDASGVYTISNLILGALLDVRTSGGVRVLPESTILASTVTLPTLPNGTYIVAQGISKDGQWKQSAYSSAFTISSNTSCAQFVPWNTTTNAALSAPVPFAAGNAPAAGITVKLQSVMNKNNISVTALHLEGANTSWPQSQLMLAGPDYTPKHVEIKAFYSSGNLSSAQNSNYLICNDSQQTYTVTQAFLNQLPAGPISFEAFVLGNDDLGVANLHGPGGNITVNP